jgi:hypothetical protein
MIKPKKRMFEKRMVHPSQSLAVLVLKRMAYLIEFEVWAEYIYPLYGISE